MILHRLLEALFENRRQHRHDLQLPARRPVPERPAPRPHPAGDRAAEGEARGGRASTTASTTGSRRCRTSKLYHTPLGDAADAEMTAAFERLAEARDESPLLQIEHREIRARRRAGGVIWFDFRELCGGPRSQNDYLELATQFHTCCCPACRRCRRASPRRRGASPGWSTCSTTAGSSSSSRPRSSPRSCTPKGRWPTSSRAPCRGCARCARWSSWRAAKRTVDTGLT